MIRFSLHRNRSFRGPSPARDAVEMTEPSAEKRPEKEQPPAPTRAQRLAAFGFLGAFGLTILTVLLTGLSVGAPAARHVLRPVPPAADSPPARASRPSGSSSGQPTPRAAGPAATDSAAGPQGSGEPRTGDNASREDSARARKDREHEDLRKDRDDSRAEDDSRGNADSRSEDDTRGEDDTRAKQESRADAER